MSDVLLFHHAQGLTDGVRAFADELRAAGPTFDSLDDGMAFAEELSFDTVIERGTRAAEELPLAAVDGGEGLLVGARQLLRRILQLLFRSAE